MLLMQSCFLHFLQRYIFVSTFSFRNCFNIIMFPKDFIVFKIKNISCETIYKICINLSFKILTTTLHIPDKIAISTLPHFLSKCQRNLKI
jgi:hypothetical protein